MRLAAVALALLMAAPTAPNVLVQYSFDDGLTDTGPDTFAVFQNAKGHVRLSTAIHYSGYRAIELHDVAGDRDFPELQGYFPERKDGQLFFHFAMLVANPQEGFNIALAGPNWFSVEPNGIGFWLKARDGVLHHVSDSIPKRLFRLEAFTWYLVDLRYDIPRGVYDLTIRREGETRPVVALKDQPNAANAPGSSVDKFSFVGSVFEDDSNVTFYVDDVVIGTDERVVLAPFVAPGRRKLFIDRWKEARELLARNPSCPPVLAMSDYGLRDDEVARLDERKLSGLEPVAAWRAGCAAMTLHPADAAKMFAEGERRYPRAPIFAISEVLALLRAKQTDAAMHRWSELEPLLQRDPRYGMLAALAGLTRGDLASAEQWLGRRAEESGDKVVTYEYYNVLLWKSDYLRAAAFAEKMARGLGTTEWIERGGDALLLAGDVNGARRAYERVLARDPKAWDVNGKLSDVFFLLGDTAREKLYREKIYGAL